MHLCSRNSQPRNRSLVSSINSMFLDLRHVSTVVFKFFNLLGFCNRYVVFKPDQNHVHPHNHSNPIPTQIQPFTSSQETTHRCLNRLTEGDNKTVLGWAAGHTSVWEKSGGRASIRRTLAKANPGCDIVLDNVGKVTLINYVICGQTMDFPRISTPNTTTRCPSSQAT